MDENQVRFVDFDKYCATCEYSNIEEKFDPCNECLDNSTNIDSSKPVCYKEKDNKK